MLNMQNVVLKMTAGRKDQFPRDGKVQIALSGRSNVGKSSLIKLLLRFYDPDEGTILYNGTDIREYDIASIRNRLATVFQDYKVFALTISENVLCRELLDNKDERIVKRAIKNSGADSCVEKLPQKENTVLTREFDEKGTGLSGGEQQKIAAARMFANDFDLAILDEPSSALDPVAENEIYSSRRRSLSAQNGRGPRRLQGSKGIYRKGRCKIFQS